jgi:hypothetical protein
MPKVRKYHIVLANGSERDITGSEAIVRDGALIIKSSGADEEGVIYAAGQWTMCELERKDDKQ